MVRLAYIDLEIWYVIAQSMNEVGIPVFALLAGFFANHINNNKRSRIVS